MSRPLVYIMGPYTNGDVAVNVALAMDMDHALREVGLVPICPHLSHFLHLKNPRPYQDWIEADLEMLRVCDYAVRLPGKSSGADGEQAKAEQWGIELFHVGSPVGKPPTQEHMREAAQSVRAFYNRRLQKARSDVRHD